MCFRCTKNFVLSIISMDVSLRILNISEYVVPLIPIPMAVQPKALVCGGSLAGIVVSNLAEGATLNSILRSKTLILKMLELLGVGRYRQKTSIRFYNFFRLMKQ